MKSVQVMGQVVDSLTVRDLMSVTLSRSSTYIIKTDIEDFDCEVLQNIPEFLFIILSQVIDPNDLQSTGHYIPYIFMEWNGESETCGDLASSLLSIGYTPWYKCQQGSVHKIYVDIQALRRTRYLYPLDRRLPSWGLCARILRGFYEASSYVGTPK